jgi:hypothetical protein
MWNGSHETWVDCLKRHLRAWKLRGPAGDGSKGQWSDETICDLIVEAHERIGGPAKTGIVFAPGSADESNRKKANAARIMRMLTDEPSTDGPSIALVNLLPSISAAMPADLATSFWNEYLAPARLGVRGLDDGQTVGFNPAEHIGAQTKESAEATLALLQVQANPSLASLEAAHKEQTDVIETATKARRELDAAIAELRSGGNVSRIVRKNA